MANDGYIKAQVDKYLKFNILNALHCNESENPEKYLQKKTGLRAEQLTR
jgi:hypothetical protein